MVLRELNKGMCYIIYPYYQKGSGNVLTLDTSVFLKIKNTLVGTVGTLVGTPQALIRLHFRVVPTVPTKKHIYM